MALNRFPFRLFQDFKRGKDVKSHVNAQSCVQGMQK